MKHPILMLCLMASMSGPHNLTNAAEPAEAQANTEQSQKIETEPSMDLGWLDLEQLARIKVSTVARKEVEVRKTAAAVHVITAEDIRRSGVTSIPEALRLAPGVEVARIDSRRYAISIRGLNEEYANKLLALQDGRSLYTPVFGGVFWDQQDTAMDDIDRIEVVRGPGGTSWGANAVNGVINIITKPAEDTQGTLVKAGGGTFEQGFGMIRHGGKINEHTWYRAYLKTFHRDETMMLNGIEGGDDFSQLRGGFRIDSLPTDRTRITLQGAAWGQDAEQSLVASATGADPTTSFGGHFIAKAHHVVDDGSELNLQSYYDASRLDGTQIDGGIDQFDIDGQYRRELNERTELNLGLNYRWIDVSLDATPGSLVFNPSDRRLNLFGAFADLEYELLPEKLTLSLGIKGQYNEFSGWDPLPNIRLIWTPKETWSMWAAVSQGISMPTVVQHDVTVMQAGAPPVTINPHTGLESEKLRAYEIGYRVRPTARLSVDVATFYNDYDDLASTEIIGAALPIPTRYANLREGEVFGVELSSVWRMRDDWRLSGTYTAQKVDLRNKLGGTDAGTATAEATSPEQQFRLTSSWDVTPDIEFDATLRFVDKVTTTAGATDDYVSMDLRLAWQARKNLELSIVGQNLLDADHPEFGASPLSPAAGQIPRSVYGQVKASF